MTVNPSTEWSGDASLAPVGPNPPSTRRVQVAYVTDTNMFQPTLISMMSAIEGSSEPITVHFFGHQLSDAERDQITRAVRHWPATQILYHYITDAMVEGGKSDGYHTPAQMAVLQIPRMLSGKVLYLDGDTLVHGDIAQLFDLDLGGNLVGATYDWARLLWVQNLPPEYPLGDHSAVYDRPAIFNTGFLLFDIDAIRSETGMVDTIANHLGLECDQKALNCHLEGRVHLLGPAWNAMPGTFHLCHQLQMSLTQNATAYNFAAPCITHFVGIAKPWHDFDVELLHRDINGVRLSVFRKLNLTGSVMPHDILPWLTNRCIVQEYASMVTSWRKSAARFLSMV